MRACDNPFRTEPVLRVRYRLSGSTWAELLARCERARYRDALVGPHGTGKTTLLEDLETRLRERGFGTQLIRLDQEQRTFSRNFLDTLFANLTARDILLFDGAEQMGALAWRCFNWRARRAAGLIITTHWAGRLPTLWECSTSPELLNEIAAELCDVDGQGLRASAAALFSKHRGNLREALRECYEMAYEEGFEETHPSIARPSDRGGLRLL